MADNPGRQLTLPVNLPVEASFQNYYLPEQSPNVQATRCLYQMAHGSGESVAFLWGGADVGVSHLLQACARLGRVQRRKALYLSLASPDWQTVREQLSQANDLDLLCVDDVDQLIDNASGQQALFHCYNTIRDAGGQLIFSSHTPPNSLALSLPDLKSRLLSGPVYELLPLNDIDKQRALQLQAHALGLQLTADVAQYIVNHSARGMAELFAVLQQLDQESLASKRRLTIPFIKQALSL